jgi:aldehyde dehydrogenase (NAD+)
MVSNEMSASKHAMVTEKPTNGNQSIDALKNDWNTLYIAGEWVDRGNRPAIKDYDPYTGKTIAEVPSATAKDIDRAFDEAESAQHESMGRSPQELAQPIIDAINLVLANSEEIVPLLITESGSTLLKAHFEIEQATVPIMREASSFPFRAFGESMTSVIPGKENLVKRQPTGIVSVISPWNFPLHQSMRVVAPALALGNAVVLKPSSDTPICGGLLLAKLFEQTSLPKGLFSVLPGSGAEVGDRVASHPKARVVAFTGSTEVGRDVASKAAHELARTAMELGGNAAHIVLEDADVDRAVEAGIFGSFFHQGQICMRINRHLVHRSIYEEYVRKFTKGAGSLVWGDPNDPSTNIGPVINEKQKTKIMKLIEQSVEEGAKVTTGGQSHGLIIEPTVMRDVKNSYSVAQNETFGPVAPIIAFESDEEAVELANGTPFGLSGSVHSRDLQRAYQVASRVETGMIHINDQSFNEEPHVPYGGVKSSGMGRYNSEAVMDEFTELKWISFQLHPRNYPF